MRYSKGNTGIKHQSNGMAGTKIYNVWISIIHRCLNKNYQRYAGYGGRGIGVCERWKEFNNFYFDMGDPPKGFSIDRINNDGNYSPKNCKWVANKENNQNMRNSKYWIVDGIRYNSCRDAGKAHDVHAATIKNWCDVYKNSNYSYFKYCNMCEI